LAIFLLAFAILLKFTVEPKLNMFYTTIAFLIGATTSIAAGFIGMKVATYTNVRTTKESAESIHKGFVVAYRGGQVLGFVLVGLAISVLTLLIIIYRAIYTPQGNG
jgi:K(+)-stimulated pyrophosphate-energized sodium pump